MTARAVEIAEAVKDAINGESFSIAFAATRRWLWFTDVAQVSASAPAVSVIPAGVVVSREGGARRLQERIWGVIVAVQQKLPETGEVSEIDGLAALLEEIYEFIEPTDASAAISPSGASYAGTDHEAGLLYDPEDLQGRLFTSLTTFQFADQR